MRLSPSEFSDREKLILAGLFLSKFDRRGVKKLGFASFAEAFNVLGYAFDGKPMSIKNYRDEFDPLVSNKRLGWHKRTPRAHCIVILKEFDQLDIETFSALIGAMATSDVTNVTGPNTQKTEEIGESSFAKRMITGLAAERYFAQAHPNLPEFCSLDLECVTHLGCGFDFRLSARTEAPFLAVEVKGLAEESGNVSLTTREYDVATSLADRYYLFVVRNFKETPSHIYFQNPISSGLRFISRKRISVHNSWTAQIA